MDVVPSYGYGEENVVKRGEKRALMRFKNLIKLGKARFTILGVGLSPENDDLKGYWKKALKSALRRLRKTYGIDYVLLFEVSEKGFDHAHIVLTQKLGETDFEKIGPSYLNDFRGYFFQNLQKQAKPETSKKQGWKEIAKNLGIEHPTQTVKYVKVFKHKGTMIPAGTGPGFVNYILAKPKVAGLTLSRGFLNLPK